MPNTFPIPKWEECAMQQDLYSIPIEYDITRYGLIGYYDEVKIYKPGHALFNHNSNSKDIQPK